MTPPVYIVSLRSLYLIPSQSCAIEMEDVFAKVSVASLFIPKSHAELKSFCREKSGEGAHIFIVAIYFGQVVDVLRSMGNWRKAFAGVHTYVFDSFLQMHEKKKNKLVKMLSSFSRTMGALDTLFIPVAQELEPISKAFGVHTEYIPIAVDIDQFGSDRPLRPIAVNAYGRQNTHHVDRLSERYNNTLSERTIHFTSHALFAKILNFRQHRAHFWKLLSMSQIALAYDPTRINPNGQFFPVSFVGQRWFESLAAGCVVVGYRPRCAEAAELLDWPDATIECPEDTDQFVIFLENLLGNEDYLNLTRSRNVYHMLLKHDWSYRIEKMLRKVQLESIISKDMEIRWDTLNIKAKKILAQEKRISIGD